MSDLFFADLVREAATGTGTEPMTLTGAPAGYRSFASVVPDGARFHYSLVDSGAGQWEVGVGQLDEAGLLTRDPLSSSDGGAAVDFVAGPKTVSLTVASTFQPPRSSERRDQP